jgi:hypothetical protein
VAKREAARAIYDAAKACRAQRIKRQKRHVPRHAYDSLLPIMYGYEEMFAKGKCPINSTGIDAVRRFKMDAANLNVNKFNQVEDDKWCQHTYKENMKLVLSGEEEEELEVDIPNEIQEEKDEELVYDYNDIPSPGKKGAAEYESDQDSDFVPGLEVIGRKMNCDNGDDVNGNDIESIPALEEFCTIEKENAAKEKAAMEKAAKEKAAMEDGNGNESENETVIENEHKQLGNPSHRMNTEDVDNEDGQQGKETETESDDDEDGQQGNESEIEIESDDDDGQQGNETEIEIEADDDDEQPVMVVTQLDENGNETTVDVNRMPSVEANEIRSAAAVMTIGDKITIEVDGESDEEEEANGESDD